MAKMTDEEFNKVLEEIVDRFTKSMMEMFEESNERMEKLMAVINGSGNLTTKDLEDMNTYQKKWDSRRKELTRSMMEQIKKLNQGAEWLSQGEQLINARGKSFK
jgi:hypothetical protein